MAAAVIGGLGAASSIIGGIQQAHTQKENLKAQQQQQSLVNTTAQQQMKQTNPYLDQFNQFTAQAQAPGAFVNTPVTAAQAQSATYDPTSIDLSQIGSAGAPISGAGVRASMIDPSLVTGPVDYSGKVQGYDASLVDVNQLPGQNTPGIGSFTGQDALNQFLNRDAAGQLPDTTNLLAALQANQGMQTDQQAARLGAATASLGQRAGTAAAMGQASLRSQLTSANNASNAQLVAGLNDSAANRALQAAQTMSTRGVDLATLQQQHSLASQQNVLQALLANAQNKNQAGQFNSQLGLSAQQLNQNAIEAAQTGRINIASSNQNASLQAAIASANNAMQAAGLNQNNQQFYAGQRFSALQANAGYANQAGMFNAGNQQQTNLANTSALNNMGQFNSQMGLSAFQANTSAQQAFQQLMLAGIQGGSSAWQGQQGLQNQALGIMAGYPVPQAPTNNPILDGLTTAAFMPAVAGRLYPGAASTGVNPTITAQQDPRLLSTTQLGASQYNPNASLVNRIGMNPYYAQLGMA